ncbi:hypothetical protein [Actinomyces succiniciruminis]|uniref:Phage protein n=1 Tax=Actinomyces succiniciruminis TaxID=1522002 RepID=A0A1L7RMB1_9ACTO|nr:hypothetical protein [Actinomyces succiniciruminis]CED90608.1 Hypothetical protein AAM4_0776 [Actinomyces succiniciruminis]
MTSAKPGRYVKRPVVVEAIQYDGSLTNALDILDWIGDATSAERSRDGDLVIHTLEGDMTADWGDYVIRGVQGEFYPCKPSVFEATYEPAPDPAQEA